MISNKTKKITLRHGDKINITDIYNNIFDSVEILKIFESINEDIRSSAMEIGDELERLDISDPESIKPKHIWPFDAMLSDDSCEDENKCLGCLLLNRLIKNNPSEIFVNGNEHSVKISYFEGDVSGWHRTDEYDYSERTLWKTTSEAEQYILCSLMSERILMGAYRCNNRYVIIEKDDVYEESVKPDDLVMQLREKMKGLSCILYTHGSPSFRFLRITPEPWFKNDIYCNFTVRLLNTDSDSFAAGNIRYCRTESPKINEDITDFQQYLVDRAFYGETDKPSEWEFNMIMGSMKKNEEFKDIKAIF